MGRPATSLFGKVFGEWKVIQRVGSTRSGAATWLCRCSCGKEKAIAGYSLTRGDTNSCGCKAPLWIGEANRTHGMTNTSLFSTWSAMLQRCYYPKHVGYKNYGERGISVCDRWKNSFEAFANDMGQKPGPDFTLDRINNDGNYEPGNCRWATKLEQAQNCRKSNYASKRKRSPTGRFLLVAQEEMGASVR